MPKVKNWLAKLYQHKQSKLETVFDFPTWNCMLWTLSCVEVATEDDLAYKYKGNFKTEQGALKLLKKLDGVSNCLEFFEKHFGETRPVSFARIGDIVFADHSTSDLIAQSDFFGLTPGICFGQTSFFVGKHGLVETETLKLSKSIWVL